MEEFKCGIRVNSKHAAEQIVEAMHYVQCINQQSCWIWRKITLQKHFRSLLLFGKWKLIKKYFHLLELSHFFCTVWNWFSVAQFWSRSKWYWWRRLVRFYAIRYSRWSKKSRKNGIIIFGLWFMVLITKTRLC